MFLAVEMVMTNGYCLLRNFRMLQIDGATWEIFKKLIIYTACAFMDKIFVIGGSINRVVTNYCLQFDISNYSCKEF